MPRSGTQYAPMLEWALAAQWWGYRYEEFDALDGVEQSHRVAVYRVAKQIEAVEAWQQSKHNRT